MEIYTIGHSGKTAEEFFGALRTAGITRVIDLRLNNKSQLLGFAKGDDLRFFLREICGSTYEHEPMLAPTAEILTAYRKKALDWGGYEEQFLRLITERRIQDRLKKEAFHVPTALLCSEEHPTHCHRRLVAEYLQEAWGEVHIRHL
ncbi:MAG: DUF488 domain-containing protein [Bacillota bacterium]